MLTSEDLLARLQAMGIESRTVEHEPLHTVAESRSLRGEIDGAHTKNLFLKDKKSRIYLVVLEEGRDVDLKTLHRVIGASGRLSFASAERMRELLGVEPGSVTAFGVVNDTAGEVSVVLDDGLLSYDMVNSHPLRNTATTTIAAKDLLRFLEETGHAPFMLHVEHHETSDGTAA